MMQNTTSSEKDLFIKLALNNWDLQNTRLNSLLDKLSDEQLMAETAPGRNTGIYLLGHLAAVNDGLFKLLGLGDRLYADWDEVFLKNPDKSGLEKPALAEVKVAWNRVSAALSAKFEQMTADEWFGPHTAITAEDFAKEPHRNKLNLILNRTNHTAYHFGQLAYLK